LVSAARAIAGAFKRCYNRIAADAMASDWLIRFCTVDSLQRSAAAIAQTLFPSAQLITRRGRRSRGIGSARAIFVRKARRTSRRFDGFAHLSPAGVPRRRRGARRLAG
jgi:hypothetical protein